MFCGSPFLHLPDVVAVLGEGPGRVEGDQPSAAGSRGRRGDRSRQPPRKTRRRPWFAPRAPRHPPETQPLPCPPAVLLENRSLTFHQSVGGTGWDIRVRPRGRPGAGQLPFGRRPRWRWWLRVSGDPRGDAQELDAHLDTPEARSFSQMTRPCALMTRPGTEMSSSTRSRLRGSPCTNMHPPLLTVRVMASTSGRLRADLAHEHGVLGRDSWKTAERPWFFSHRLALLVGD